MHSTCSHMHSHRNAQECTKPAGFTITSHMHAMQTYVPAVSLTWLHVAHTWTLRMWLWARSSPWCTVSIYLIATTPSGDYILYVVARWYLVCVLYCMFFFVHDRTFIQLMLILCCFPLISLFPPISLNRRNRRRKRRMMTRMSTPRLLASTSSFLRTLATSTSSGPTSTRPEICMAVMSQGFQVCVWGRGVSLFVWVSVVNTLFLLCGCFQSL